MRSVALGDTFYFAFSSRAFDDGVPEALGGTPDLSCIELDASAGVIDSGVTVAAHGTITALNVATVVATSANGFEAGKVYSVVIDTGTVDSVSVVGEQVYEFYVETAAQTAARLFYESVYPTGCVIATVTGNTTGRINLSDVLDAQTTDADQVGKILTVWDASNGQVLDVLLTSVQSARLFNVENVIDGSAMDFTVAAGDRVWLRDVVAAPAVTGGGLDAAGVRSAVGLASADLDTQLGTIAGYIDTEIATLLSNLSAVLTDTGTTLDNKIDAIDTVVDAIRAVTDNLPNSGALTNLDAAISSRAVAGDEMALVDGAITAAKIASNAIAAAKLADNAITAAKIASDAITEIQNGLATAAGVTAIRGIPAKNAAFTFTFTMHDATDGFSLEPGITVTAEVSQEGGNYAAASGAVTEIEEGLYQFAGAAGDMNADYGAFKFTGTGCRPTVVPFVTDGGV